MQLLTVGPLPPEWGGPRRGGVATFHRAFIEHADCRIVTIAAADAAPVQVLTPPAEGQQRWYAEQASRADCVLMLHVAHRWATYHARERPAPAVGAVRSWTPILSRSGEERKVMHTRIQTNLDAMDALVFPSRHARDHGQELGFRYATPAHVIHNPLATTFLERADIAHTRSGVVFVGTPAKNPELVEEACRRLDVPSLTMIDEPQTAVRAALLDAAVLSVPSNSESFGNVYIEALACGAPVVGYAPSVTEIAETVGQDVGVGLYQPNAELVTAAIAHVLARDWNRQGLRDAVLDSFHPSPVVRRYLDLAGAVSRTSRP